MPICSYIQFLCSKYNQNKILQMGIWQKLKSFCKQFDMFSAQATLRVREQPQVSSVCAGILSIAVCVAFAYVFITNLVQIYSYESLASSQTETKLPGDDVSANNLMFGIMINFLNSTLAYEYFDVSLVAFAIDNIYDIQLQACEASQWALLGDDYESQFQQYDLGNFLCPVSNTYLNLAGTFKKTRMKQIKMQISMCTNSSTCALNSTKMAYYNSIISTNRTFTFEIYFLDQAYNASAQDPISYFVNNEYRMTFTLKRGADITIQMGSFQITTDTNMWPWEQNDVQSGNFVDTYKKQTYQITVIGDLPFAIVTMLMGRRMIYVDRVRGKIDGSMSYVGGLFAIVIGFFGFFMVGFNQDRYELIVAEGCFNYDTDGKRIREKDFHFYNYVILTIYEWLSTLLCLNLEWKHSKQIKQTCEEVVYQMDIVRISKKIRNLETALLYLMSQKQKICLTLYQPPAIEQVKRNRLIADYYDCVIGGKPAVTIQDIKIVGQVLRMGINLAEEANMHKDKTSQPVELGSHNHIFQIQDSSSIFIEHKLTQQEQQKLISDRANILQIILERFPQFRNEAKNIYLNQEQLKIQLEIAQSFFKLGIQQRGIIQQKIPLKVLHRLKLRMDEQEAKPILDFALSLDSQISTYR